VNIQVTRGKRNVRHFFSKPVKNHMEFVLKERKIRENTCW